MLENPWYQNAVFYEVYVRAFYDSNGDGIGDLNGLKQKLDYLKELGIDCLWLLPIYPSPRMDDGYDIKDYCNIHPDYGTLQDFRQLIEAAHARGLRIITDLVLNHTSDQHPWFQAARVDRASPYRDYYVWSDTNEKYAQARIIFVDTEKSNWAWDEAADQYYWHRFFTCQPDLNFDNPAVRSEILNIMKFWLEIGVDGFRMDAVPYLFEREGTDCENLPETHGYLQELRRFMDQYFPGRILLCEANQWPRDVQAYFGSEVRSGGLEQAEFHMAFHFPLMPRIFMALRQGDWTPIQWAIDETPSIPAGCQWCTFLRNHDELTLEMVTPEERQWMWQEYAPDPKMKLNLGIRRRLAPLLDNDITRIELANAIIFSLPGTPIIYYGDEIGMGDAFILPDRNGVRTPMQWDASPIGGFSSGKAPYTPVISEAPYSPEFVNVADQRANIRSLWGFMQRLIETRKMHPALGTGEYTRVDCGSRAVLGYSRKSGNEQILIVNNLGREPVSVNVPVANPRARLSTIFGRQHDIHVENGQFRLDLNPSEFTWLEQI
jgi:maltose alpha-D-glucosyltransferase / alpha-amylase